MKKLLIIESPNKIKTLTKYLDKDFQILATVGHIRDLSSFGFGFDQKTFEPKWEIPNPKKSTKNKAFSGQKSKAEIIKEIQKISSKSDEIFLATDPDREGEAIAWHVYDILDKNDKNKCKRITFNEITKPAIIESFNHKREIDLNWVHSQFSRRIVDRLIGYKLSKLMQKKLKAESAGRVQSVVLKFINEREKEISGFIPQYWWTIETVLENDISLILKEFDSSLSAKTTSENFSTGINFADYESANCVLNSLGEQFEIIAIDDPSFSSNSPKPVYKTSTLQQDAINKLNWSSKKTTSVAQRLYEGIEIDNNHVALISYPRTDSVRISDTFLKSCQEFITQKYGIEYLGKNETNRKAEAKQETNVQNAHEGIRPIDVSITPESLKNKISKDDYQLYKLIWIRTVASLMSNAKFKKVTIRFKNNNNIFYTSSRECVFDGFKKIYFELEDNEKDNLIDLSKLKVGNVFNQKTMLIKDHQTNPPGKYTQASLIAELERVGVGRPSTYSSMVNIALERGYATLENRSFVMTEMGKEVIVHLDKFFSNVINKDFTKNMEEHLDKIAAGNENWKTWIQEFAPTFEQEVQTAYDSMEKKADEKVNRLCPLCNSDLLYKHSKGGNKFIGCSGFPKCKYLESLEKKEILPQKCPECNSDLLMCKSKKGSKFVGCTSWPKCNYILSEAKYKKFLDEKLEKLPTKKELESNKSKK